MFLCVWGGCFSNPFMDITNHQPQPRQKQLFRDRFSGKKGKSRAGERKTDLILYADWYKCSLWASFDRAFYKGEGRCIINTWHEYRGICLRNVQLIQKNPGSTVREVQQYSKVSICRMPKGRALLYLISRFYIKYILFNLKFYFGHQGFFALN